ncbi:MAG: dockerin type I domain-containing protein [Candidatus Parcubacteria bacterium]|nr:dockerin type I domain-containing protein [Candidatus Parcubacteria bacterium]
MTPPAGNFYVGDNISFSLLVNTPNLSINTVEGTITFPTDKLQVTSLSKTDSIFNLWIQEPSFSNQNSTGTIMFIGGLPTPGFIGIAGQIITISFKVVGYGDAVLGITDARILANDGLGTNILTSVTPSQLTLLKPKVKTENSDINEDDKVNLFDLSILIANWGTPKNTRTDLNRDGVVDAKDVSILLSKWTTK